MKPKTRSFFLGKLWPKIQRNRDITIVLLLCAMAIVGYLTFAFAIEFEDGGGEEENNDGSLYYSFELSWENMRSPDSSLTWDDLSPEDQEFLDMVQEAAFWYFWNEANPSTGLVQDRATNNTVSSTAATGFGLSAICVAESRGWITYEEACTRVLNTLRSFDPSNPLVQGTHGFFYHWINTATGRREWNSEISLIDTALFIAGVLHAGEHFKERNMEIWELADRIYRAVEWDWIMTGDLMKATPESGGKTGYDEYILAYILALGSPTHPIPERSWDAWAASYAWYDYGGVKFLTPGGGRTMLAYLYQFPACWIDFRDKHDNYANYWNEFTAALKANMDFCIDESVGNGWPALWGWTACDGKNGYLGYRDTFDGTVAPSAVAASLPFMPEEALSMLKSMYEEYGSQIWREYGFVNSFNPSQNWYDHDYVGIDQGNLVLMIEAFRSGSVWEEFMSNTYVVEGLRRAGFCNGYHTDSQGFIRDWLVIGPFGSSEEEAFNTDFIGETSIGYPKAGDPCGGKTWMEYHGAFSEPSSSFVDLYRVFTPRENCGAYAYVLLLSDSDKTVRLRVGSDDSIKVWVNDELVHSNHALRGATKDQDVVDGVQLMAGTNRILVKVCNASGGWGFYLRFTDHE